MAKTITDAQVTGQRGEEMVAMLAHEMGFIFSHRGQPEAGVDGFLEIRDPVDGRVTGQFVAVQVKTTTAAAYPGETEIGFDYTMREEDVAYWRGTNIPVVIVLVNLAKHIAYWKSIESGHGAEHRRLRIDKTRDVFDKDARDAIANLCIDRGRFGVYVPALNHGERAHLNLLKVNFPATVYVGFSPYKTGQRALSALLKGEDRPPDDWVIRGGQFMSFRDPRTGPLAEIVDGGAVEPIDSIEVAFPDEEADEHAFIELLRRTVAAQVEGVLSFDKLRRVFYFPAQPRKIERAYYYESLKSRASANVVRIYRRGGMIKYVRHHAFEPRFWRVDDEWLMSVTPTFHFTWDGIRPDKFASNRLSGKKQREFNSALNGQLAMWRYLLVDDRSKYAADLFPQEPAMRPLVSFDAVEPLELQRAVPEDVWRKAHQNVVDDGLFAGAH